MFAWAALAAGGCGPGGEDGDASSPNGNAGADSSVSGDSPDAPPGQKVYTRTLEQISPTGDETPPLDGGRVVMARPEDWRVGSRQSKLVVWFHKFNDPNLLPQIRVKAEDAPEDAPEASVENVTQFAQWVDRRLQEELGEEKLVEPVVPLVLGENAFARYVRAGKFKSSLVDRQILETIEAGRLYRIETIVFQGGLKEKRENVLDGYAVGASLKKAPEGSVGGFPTPGETDGSDDNGDDNEGEGNDQ